MNPTFLLWQAPPWGPGRAKVLNRSVARLWTLLTWDLDSPPSRDLLRWHQILGFTAPGTGHHHSPPHAGRSEVRGQARPWESVLTHRYRRPPGARALLFQEATKVTKTVQAKETLCSLSSACLSPSARNLVCDPCGGALGSVYFEQHTSKLISCYQRRRPKSKEIITVWHLYLNANQWRQNTGHRTGLHHLMVLNVKED